MIFHSTMAPHDASNLVGKKKSRRQQTNGDHADVRRMTPPLVSDEIRKQVADAAAEVGHLTRLVENVVESVALDRSSEHDTYYLKAGIHSSQATPMTPFYLVIQEAAAVGSVYSSSHGRKEEVVSSSHSRRTGHTAQPEEDATVPLVQVSPFQQQLNQRAATHSVIQATDDDDPGELVNQYVAHRRKVRSKEVMDYIAKAEKMQQSTQQQQQYKTQQMKLPSSELPRLQRPPIYLTAKKLKASVVRGVANQALDRQTRLVVDGTFRVRHTCSCLYCLSPSPYQTQAYAKLKSKKGWSDDSLQDESGHNDTASNTAGGQALKSSVRPSLASALSNTVHGPDPNVPSAFRDLHTSKHHQRAWKERAKRNQGLSSTIHVQSPPQKSARAPPSWASPRLKKAPPQRTHSDDTLNASFSNPEWMQIKQTLASPTPTAKGVSKPKNYRPKTSMDGDMDEEELLMMQLQASLNLEVSPSQYARWNASRSNTSESSFGAFGNGSNNNKMGTEQKPSLPLEFSDSEVDEDDDGFA